MSMVGFKAQNHHQQTAARGALDEVDDRGTKWEFVRALEDRLGGRFTLDAAAAPHNAKADRFYTRADNGLAQPWTGRVWCNPPYSRLRGVMDLGDWCRKAWHEWGRADLIHQDETMPAPSLIAMLLPANRVEQSWWQDHIEPFRDRPGSPLRIEFQRGRMRFDMPPGWETPEKGDRPPFGLVLAIWQNPPFGPESGGR